ncbi:MAG: translocation/assembly module TamB domain-containing protein [Selenomonadaceae bacterium]|nr:translocation/assembly module TamB domain-containing protein [Selenomonadaceae bacterium]
MNKFVKIAGGILGSVAIFGGLYVNSQRDEIIKDAMTMIEEKASKAVGTEIKIGRVDVDELNWTELKGSSITVRDVEILDKKGDTIATADRADIKFKLLSLYDDAAGAIDEIDISGVNLDLKKRSSNKWNFEDIKLKSEGESNFGAKINIKDSTVKAEFDGKTIKVTDINASADCANLNAIGLEVNANVLGSQVQAAGVVGAENQAVQALIDTVDVSRFLEYLPEGKLPEGLTIYGGHLKKTQVNFERRGNNLKYFVESDVENGLVQLEDTHIENIKGKVKLDDSRVWFDASASANGQSAKARGNVYTNTDKAVFDIYAESNSFAPAAVIKNIGVEGAAKFHAHLTGTAENPQVEAEIFSPYVRYENIEVGNLRTHLNYVDDKIYLTNVSGQTFGGDLAGEIEIVTSNMAYNGHFKANGIDSAQILSFANSDVDFNGDISADLAINGVGDQFRLYGSAKTPRADYQNYTFNDAKLSFYYDKNVFKIDNFNAQLENNGAIGCEGIIADGKEMELEFFASHVDLTTAKSFNEQIDVSGLADINGIIRGSLDNPQIAMRLSAVDSSDNGGFTGSLFNQPYDSIKLEAMGTLDEININEFRLEKDGNIVWRVEGGTVALTGDKRINLEVNTKDARLENILKAFSSDLQDITGDITNKIRISGTLDNPHVVGKVLMNYGSYKGILITGVEGEYSYEGDKLKLQNFYVESPMADVVLNGTLDRTTGALDFAVEGRDISLKRFKTYFPENYHAEGHGTFEGNLRGTIDNPNFVGRFVSHEINLNGVELTGVHGAINVTSAQILLEDFRFNQDDGNFKMDVGINMADGDLTGKVTLQNVDIPALTAIANKKDIPILGKLDSDLTIRSDSAQLTGKLLQGEIGGCDVHDVELEINFVDDIIYFNKFNGKQGDIGNFNLLGKIDKDDVIDINFAAKDIALSMFSGLAGIDAEVTGTTDINVKLGGTTSNPNGEGILTAKGSINGAAFDLMKANILLKNWTFDIKEFFAQREIAGTVYKVNAFGKIPIQSLYIDPGENLSIEEQLNLNIGLDDADLTLLPVFDKYVDWATGDIDGNLTVTGTLARPNIDGKFVVDDGTIKLKFMSSPIEHLNISTRFKDDRFDIEKFVGNIGKGNFNLEGGFNFANFALNGYNFNLKMNALDIKSIYFNGPLTAEFTVNEITGFDGRLFPKIEGQIDLNKCTMSVPVLPDSDEPLPDIILDISVNLGEKFRLYSSHLYDMYLTGSARFEGTTNHPKPSGSISVKRGGTLTYANSVFDIREGEAHFNQFDTFFPYIHFLADTKLSRTKIFLSVDGSLNDMKIKLTSNPEMSETEIIQALTLRENFEKGNSNITASDILALGLQMSLLADIEDTVRKTLGVDQLRFTRGSGSAFDYYADEGNKRSNDFNIFIGKYISDKIMLRYTQGINGDRITRYGFQYDINNNIGVTIEREGNQYIFGLEAKWNF